MQVRVRVRVRIGVPAQKPPAEVQQAVAPLERLVSVAEQVLVPTNSARCAVGPNALSAFRPTAQVAPTRSARHWVEANAAKPEGDRH